MEKVGIEEIKGSGFSVILPQEVYETMKLEINNLRELTGFGAIEDELLSLRKKNDLLIEKN